MACVWADHSTVGIVFFAMSSVDTPYPITEDQAAGITRTTRDAMTIAR
ncbi:hypothetical protein ACIGXM_31815 [Kitasatospora sp. NPDC052896]